MKSKRTEGSQCLAGSSCSSHQPLQSYLLEVFSFLFTLLQACIHWGRLSIPSLIFLPLSPANKKTDFKYSQVHFFSSWKWLFGPSASSNLFSSKLPVSCRHLKISQPWKIKWSDFQPKHLAVCNSVSKAQLFVEIIIWEVEGHFYFVFGGPGRSFECLPFLKCCRSGLGSPWFVAQEKHFRTSQSHLHYSCNHFLINRIHFKTRDILENIPSIDHTAFPFHSFSGEK